MDTGIWFIITYLAAVRYGVFRYRNRNKRDFCFSLSSSKELL
jgi:hypothetical protein